MKALPHLIWFAALPLSAGVTIRPAPHPPEDGPQYIAFHADADWLEGSIRVRFPENIYSDQGLHFLDNVAPELKRVSKVAVPKWKVDEESGALSYEVRTGEGIHFNGHVHVEGETIHMRYTVENRSGKATGVDSQVCFDMSTSPSLDRRVTLDTTHTWIDGEFTCLSTTTSPKRDAKFQRNGYNWLLMLYEEQPDDPMRRIEDECPWWIVDQKPDLPIIARETRDRRHLVAIIWEDANVRRLMTNTNIPCLHADPLRKTGLKHGETHTWRGRIFMMKNDPERLLAAYRATGSPPGSATSTHE